MTDNLKIATVVSWPSIDAKAPNLLSDWEYQVFVELARAANFPVAPIFTAFPKHVRYWPECFISKKPGSPPTPDVEAARQNLHKQLVGYDIVLALGSHAMWALTGETSLDTYRGTHIDSPFVAGLQVVPTYEPRLFAYANWSDRPVVASAMRKATARYVDKQATIYLPDCVVDLQTFTDQHIKQAICFDVETNIAARITEFSVAASPEVCLYVQLEKQNQSIWSAEDELQIYLWLHRLACRRDLTWIMHNATYDLSYLDAYGVRPAGPIVDTMLMGHAWQPEWEKGLGFLTAMHLPTRAWKHLRRQAKAAINKAGAV